MFAFSCCIGRALLLRPFRRLSLSIAVAFSLQAGGLTLAGDLTPAIVSIPLPAFQGTEAGGMTTQVFLPEGKAPFPVVIFSHGRAPTAEGRANLKIPVLPGHVGYWQAKGFAVVAPIRPGYGATGGPDREASGVRWDQENRCGGKPDLPGALNRAAFAVRNAVDWARTQSWARNDRILLVGQSVGGMTSVVLGGQNPPGVVGIINFSGGAAGNPEKSPGRSCAVDDVGAVFRTAGQTARVPSLWLYAPNDLFWGPDVPRAWHKAFAAGGSASRFVMTAPVADADGHNLLRKGGKLWSEEVNPFVKSLGF